MLPLPLYRKEGRKIKPVPVEGSWLVITPGHPSLSSTSPPATGDSTGVGQLEPRSPNHSVTGGPNTDRLIFNQSVGLSLFKLELRSPPSDSRQETEDTAGRNPCDSGTKLGPEHADLPFLSITTGIQSP